MPIFLFVRRGILNAPLQLETLFGGKIHKFSTGRDFGALNKGVRGSPKIVGTRYLFLCFTKTSVSRACLVDGVVHRSALAFSFWSKSGFILGEAFDRVFSTRVLR